MIEVLHNILMGAFYVACVVLLGSLVIWVSRGVWHLLGYAPRGVSHVLRLAMILGYLALFGWLMGR